MQRSEQRPGQVSMADVASRAGVSTATVSRSLRAGSVAPKTRDRVLQAAHDLQYVRSPAASHLASGRTQTIGIVVPFAARWFFSEVIAGAESVLRPAGFDLLLYDIRDPDSRSRFFAGLPLRRRVDSVLVVASGLRQDEQDRLFGLGIPLCVLGGHIAGSPSVGIDEEQAAAVAVRHLVGLGHRRVAMISGNPDDVIGASTTSRRQAGYRAALAEAGITDATVVTQDWGVAGGARAMEQLLEEPVFPTAVFAESDEMAFGALRTLRNAHIQVPERMSVIGIDDHEFAYSVGLTTIAQPVREQGAAAASALLRLLAGGSDEQSVTLMPTRLIVRGSTAPAVALNGET